MKILGINNEVTTCECCGRINLKRTVVLASENDQVHYGTECAARAMKCDKKDVEKGLRTAERAKAKEEARQRQNASNEAWEKYNAWLLQTYGDTRSNLERNREYKKAVAA